jgi:hypothetical protein
MRIVVPCVAAALTVIVPQPATPQRDVATAEPVHVVRGVIRSIDAFAPPLRRARVIAREGSPVFTGSDGRFAIRVSLPAIIRVSKPGYAPRDIPIPSTVPDDLEIQLARGAIVGGDVTDEAGGPATGIGVRVRRVDSGDAGLPIDAIVASDDLGRFRLGSLPAGDYELSVPGDREAALRPRTLVHVRTGEYAGVALRYDARADDVRTAAEAAADYEAARRHLLRGLASLEGRVFDPFGRAVAGARLLLEPTVAAAASVARMASPDSQGRFQFLNVDAGAYRLRATKAGLVAAEHGQPSSMRRGTVITVHDGQAITGVDVTMFRSAVVSGMVADVEGEPIEGIAMHAWQVVSRGGRQVAEPALDVLVGRTDDRGQYRIFALQPGAYYVVATEAPVATWRAAPEVADAPRSYYPGVGTLEEGRTVQVDVALDASGVDMTFRTAATYRVSGEARTSTGVPLNRPVLLTGRPRVGMVTMPPLKASMRGPAFVFEHVLPGSYVLQGIHTVDGPSGPEAVESGMLRVTIPSSDITLGLFKTSVGSTISGQLTAEGGSVPAFVGQWIDMVPVDADFIPFTTPRPWTVRTRSDGSFEISGLQGQLRFVGTDAIPAGWWLKSVRLNGRNATEVPFTFGALSLRLRADALLSPVAAEISGRVLNSRKEPVATYVAAAFAADRGRWYAGSRYVRATLPELNGEFSLGGLPPGDYYVVALDRFDARSVEDPVVLQRLLPLARRVSISVGQTLKMDLPLAANTFSSSVTD